MKNHILKGLVLGSLFTPIAALAESPDNSWFIAAGSGASFPIVYHSYYVNAGPGWPNDKYRNYSAESIALLSLSGGYMMYSNQCWAPFFSLGLNYTYAFTSQINGSLTQYSIPAFQNYNYHYDIKRQTLLAFIKTNIYQINNVLPFITLSGGVSVN